MAPVARYLDHQRLLRRNTKDYVQDKHDPVKLGKTDYRLASAGKEEGSRDMVSLIMESNESSLHGYTLFHTHQ